MLVFECVCGAPPIFEAEYPSRDAYVQIRDAHRERCAQFPGVSVGEAEAPGQVAGPCDASRSGRQAAGVEHTPTAPPAANQSAEFVQGVFMWFVALPAFGAVWAWGLVRSLW